MNSKKIIVTGLIFIIVGILSGAFGAHYLQSAGLAESQIKGFITASTYLFYNGLGYLAIVAISPHLNFEINTQYRFILWGSTFFSGSIFIFVLFSLYPIEIPGALRMITPIGGFLLILGWSSLLIKYLRTS